MADEAAPRTKLDFIYQEVLGEVAELVKRLEAVAATLREAASASGAERSAETLERAAAEATRRVRVELERAGEAERRRFEVLVGNALRATDSATAGVRWRGLARTAAVSLVAAFLGGAAIFVLQRVAG